jgi:hypothetical protein
MIIARNTIIVMENIFSFKMAFEVDCNDKYVNDKVVSLCNTPLKIPESSDNPKETQY